MTSKSTKKASKKKNGSEEPEELELEPSPAFQAKLNGDAPEVIVDEPPAAVYEYYIDQPATLIPLLRDAWNAARNKDDADFDSCAPEFKGVLLAHALGVINTPALLGGDSPIAEFERKVAAIKNKELIKKLG